MDDKKQKYVENFLKLNPHYLESIHRALYEVPDSEKTIYEDAESNQQLTDIAVRAIEIVENKRKKRRRILWSAATCFLILAFNFFIFTSPGQAFADSVYKTIAGLFNGDLIVQHGDSEVLELDSLKPGETITVNTVQEAANYFDEEFIYIDTGLISPEIITIERNEGVTITLTEYKYENKHFFLQQHIYDDKTMVSATVPAEGETYTKYDLFNGNKMYVSVTPEGNFIGVATWNNIQLQLITEDIAEQELESFIQDFKAI